ncbi:MAG TPA: C-terminal binding protein [Candidatus Ratteibacteria bacterium]|jgi:D-3-phosphoglycerate dehydrogenase|uniref:(S)-sulfolactate dehydrogenase n=1 Tax=candidate division TA06 bacterium ADurb.Bin131 TaxID=1852827 RepID=A0A1V6C506_UNCT6|nr:MAG: (S)-sulfolactate dehydrogenase [candidate division TA06 bacterium ADurb.Bin131]HOC02519.1 C-terminal binding protein [bacterium]HRS05721.1 C-terminal binding protein [Candidatus Ratteibacteria bacterium]HON04791.1 C-terminal binding protein [bacterium]HOQ81930.1 C-terminal binding protein [bacterium]
MVNEKNKFTVINIDPDAHRFRKKDYEKLAGIGARLIEVKIEKNISKILQNVDVIIFTGTKITSTMIKHLKKCRFIIRCGTGMDNIDIKSATEKGIMVSNVVEFCTEEVSDHALMFILACCRRLKKFFILDSIKTVNNSGYIGSINNQTLGLVGFGKIARSLAKKARCLGMKVICYDPLVESDILKSFGVKKASLQDVLKNSDYISLHCPLTEKTWHLIGKKEMELMKNTAYLINTSRGGLIDEKSLIKALRNNQLAGAGLDVFEKEPLDKDNPLLYMDNVICTPHYAYYSEKSINVLKDIVIDEVVRVLNGKVPKNLCNHEVLKNIKQ